MQELCPLKKGNKATRTSASNRESIVNAVRQLTNRSEKAGILASPAPGRAGFTVARQLVILTRFPSVSHQRKLFPIIEQIQNVFKGKTNFELSGVEFGKTRQKKSGSTEVKPDPCHLMSLEEITSSYSRNSFHPGFPSN